MTIWKRLFHRQLDEIVKTTAEKELDRLLPPIVERIIRQKLERQPNLPLSAVGFGWALGIALQKHWPEMDLKTAAKWMWDYIGVPFGSKGYSWTYEDAKEFALQYVQEFGEAA